MIISCTWLKDSLWLKKIANVLYKVGVQNKNSRLTARKKHFVGLTLKNSDPSIHLTRWTSTRRKMRSFQNGRLVFQRSLLYKSHNIVAIATCNQNTDVLGIFILCLTLSIIYRYIIIVLNILKIESIVKVQIQ